MEIWFYTFDVTLFAVSQSVCREIKYFIGFTSRWKYAWFAVIAAVLLKVKAFWYVIPCQPVRSAFMFKNEQSDKDKLAEMCRYILSVDTT
jgi:hypothetical protein